MKVAIAIMIVAVAAGAGIAAAHGHQHLPAPAKLDVPYSTPYGNGGQYLTATHTQLHGVQQ